MNIILCSLSVNYGSVYILPISLVQVHLGFISSKNLIPEHVRLFRCFLAKSNLALLFLNVTSGLHLVVNPLYLPSWRCLLIVDLDNDVPSFSRGFLISVDVKKGFSSPRNGFCDHPLQWFSMVFQAF